MTPPYNKLLVLDLDETLVNSLPKDSNIRTLFPPDLVGSHYDTYWRPYVTKFLDEALASFRDVAIWTAGTLSYAYPIVRALVDPSRLAFVWGRERCMYRWYPETDQHVHLKPLKKLLRRGYKAHQVLFVDDSPEKLSRSYSNLVPIRPFYRDPGDTELPKLMRYLHTLGPVPNIRPIEKRGWWRAT